MNEQHPLTAPIDMIEHGNYRGAQKILEEMREIDYEMDDYPTMETYARFVFLFIVLCVLSIVFLAGIFVGTFV